jgi:chemotaxis protein CheZ
MGHSDRFAPPPDATGIGLEDSGLTIRVWGDAASVTRAAVARAVDEERPAPEGAHDGQPAPDLYHRIGNLTRTLHDALVQLGYHDELADSHSNLPDARQRLAYIARVTGEAAEKVLNSVDQARALQDAMSGRAQALHKRWQAIAAYRSGMRQATPAGRALVEETCAFLGDIGEQAGRTNSVLTEIMMAQDFHDLTGQVIRKVVKLSQDLEEQLVKLLVDAQPAQRRAAPESSALAGPVVDAQERTDVVTDQAGVDDLLASLGF